MAAKVSLTPAQQKQVLIGVLALVGLVAWFNFFLAPQRRALADLRLQVEETRAKVEQVRQHQAEKPAWEEEMARLKEEYGFPESPPPPEEQLPELLKTLTAMARQNGVRLLGSKPTSEVNKLLPGPSGYLEVQVLIVVLGGYHQVASFLDTLESSPELLRMRELMFVHANGMALGQHAGVLLLQAYLVPGKSGAASA